MEIPVIIPVSILSYDSGMQLMVVQLASGGPTQELSTTGLSTQDELATQINGSAISLWNAVNPEDGVDPSALVGLNFSSAGLATLYTVQSYDTVDPGEPYLVIGIVGDGTSTISEVSTSGFSFQSDLIASLDLAADSLYQSLAAYPFSADPASLVGLTFSLGE